MPFLLLFVVLPLIEIALFIVIGGRLGLWPTLALVVLGGLTGVMILRANKARAAQVMEHGLGRITPGTFLAQGAFQVVAGILLIMPGFFTDTLGLVLLVPPVQRAILRFLRARVKLREAHVHVHRHPGRGPGGAPGRPPGGEVIEGEYETRDESDPDRRIDDRRSH